MCDVSPDRSGLFGDFLPHPNFVRVVCLIHVIPSPLRMLLPQWRGATSKKSSKKYKIWGDVRRCGLFIFAQGRWLIQALGLCHRIIPNPNLCPHCQSHNRLLNTNLTINLCQFYWLKVIRMLEIL